MTTKNNYKSEILENICYTDLVYERINKKLKMRLSREEIEDFILSIIKEVDEPEFHKKGKNIYITNINRKVRLTINSHTKRMITVDKLSK